MRARAPTKTTRRAVLKSGAGAAVYALAVAAGLVPPARAQTGGWNKAAFEGKTFAEAAKALGAASPTQSAAVRFVSPTPDIAENGAAVPIAVASTLAGTESIALLIAKNPNTLAANFSFAEGTDAFVSTRVKMSETSDVFALVKAEGKYYYARKEIRVTIGGCGD
jgi:sulfur-oxidizing protein SoxY